MQGPPTKKLKAEVRNRPEGLQRELYQLMGEHAPPVLARSGGTGGTSGPGPKFKQRPDWRQGPTPWTWQPFTNRKARQGDSLELFHWVRGTGGDRDGVYAFAKYAVPPAVPEWQDDEYAKFARDDWTLEETQYLFEVCRDYDLKWLVVHDRYDGDPRATPGRSVEDLKERYYEVCSALLKSRAGGASALGPGDEELLAQMRFDREAEQRRKAHLERLLSRTPSEVAEEEALVLEARRLESLAATMLGDRQKILALLDSPLSDGSIAAYQSSQGAAQLQQELMNMRSRRIPDAQGPSPVRRSLTSTAAAPAGSAGAGARTAQALRKRFGPKEEAAYGIAFHDRLSSGVYLRSTKLPALRQSTQQRAQAVLNELGLPTRPAMPTSRISAAYDSLVGKINILLDAKKAADKLAADIDVLKAAR